MAYAHARGVIHRDLKPSNIMVGSFGEVQVMDWGLAKVLAGGRRRRSSDGPVVRVEAHESASPRRGAVAAATRSRPGSVMGTPAYMAPEQARGEVDALDERADVFALGSILCEILTGRPAFAGRTGRRSRGGPRGARSPRRMARLDGVRGRCRSSTGLAARLPGRRGVDGRPRDARAVARRITAYRAGVQERLRAAELARVEAQARAEEEAKRRGLADQLAAAAVARAAGERRRRRLAVALAASIVALLVCGGGGLAACLYPAPGLAGAGRRGPEGGRAAARPGRGRSRRRPRQVAGGPRRAPSAARPAGRRARRGPSRARLDALDAQVERGAAGRAAVDRRLVDRLEEIRGGMVADDKADAAFAEAFAAAGYDRGRPGRRARGDRPAPGRSAPRRRPGAAAALDTWAVVRRYVASPAPASADPGRRPPTPGRRPRRRPRPLAQSPCATPWPPATPALAAAGSPTTPTSTARDRSASGCSGHSLEMAGDAQPGARGPPPRPSHLSRRLLAQHRAGPGPARRGPLGPGGDQLLDHQPGHPRRAVPAGRAVLHGGRRPAPAVRLGAPAPRHGDAQRRGSGTRRFAEFREALRLQPDDPTIHNSLGLALPRYGEPDEAAAEFREAIRLSPALRPRPGQPGRPAR